MRFAFLIFLCCIYALLNVGGAALIKKQLTFSPINQLQDYIPLLLKPRVILGFFIILLSALVMFKALSLTQFSVVVPISNGINFALTILTGVLIFNDKITLQHIVGLSFILIGIILISVVEKS